MDAYWRSTVPPAHLGFLFLATTRLYFGAGVGSKGLHPKDFGLLLCGDLRTNGRHPGIVLHLGSFCVYERETERVIEGREQREGSGRVEKRGTSSSRWRCCIIAYRITYYRYKGSTRAWVFADDSGCCWQKVQTALF